MTSAADAEHTGDTLTVGDGVEEPAKDGSCLSPERGESLFTCHRLEAIHEDHDRFDLGLHRLFQEVEETFRLEHHVDVNFMDPCSGSECGSLHEFRLAASLRPFEQDARYCGETPGVRKVCRGGQK